MNDVSRMAKTFCFAAHTAVGQTRKYTGDPYHLHCYAVADGVRQFYSSDEDVLAAAYLHDVVEDTAVTTEDLWSEFGETVAYYVGLLTDVDRSSGNRATRKELDRNRLSVAPAEVQAIKCADLTDNTESIVAHDPDFAVLYLGEKRALMEVMSKVGGTPVAERAWSSLEVAEAALSDRHGEE